MSCFIYFFRDYGLTNRPSSPRTVSCKKDNLVKILSCLLILGQIIGALEIKFGCEGLKSKYYPEKIIATSLVCRGTLTFLGLGIICLLIDIIITCTIFIKTKN